MSLSTFPAFATADLEARCKEWAWEYAIPDEQVSEYIRSCVAEQTQLQQQPDAAGSDELAEGLELDLQAEPAE